MRKLFTALTLGLAAAAAAHAQAWPAKPVTLLVPFPPGGSTDLIARTLGAKLQEKLGGSFIVDNKAGAGGTVGAAQAKRAAPDGYTIFVSSLGPFVIGPHLVKSVQYDPLKDFDYITVAVQAPNVLTVPASSPHKTYAEFLASIKANPGKMTFASAGNGTSDHLTAELFWQTTGTAGVHVPYKGGAPAMNDLLGGQVDATFMNINTGLPNIKAGKLRALAITSTARSPLLPDVPTMAEQGIKVDTGDAWTGMWASAKAPKEQLERVQNALKHVMGLPEVREQLLKTTLTPDYRPGKEMDALQRKELAYWGPVIKQSGFTPQQ